VDVAVSLHENTNDFYEDFSSIENYIRQNGDFDIRSANNNYRDNVLTNMPERYRILLEEALNEVVFEKDLQMQRRIALRAKSGKIAYNPEIPSFLRINYPISLTHELAHWLDNRYFLSFENKSFINALKAPVPKQI